MCLLAPTINIQRSPIGGRAFESFSEDPTVSGQLAASYVNGLQENGVSATIKHFVGNDQEHERNGEDSVIAARPFREIYLRAFQIAQARAKPWAYMTGYNKVNGTHCAENNWLLQDTLRREWGHDGLIMSDWYGTYSVSEGINAGLNLEMPGPTIWRTEQLVSHLINAHKINTRTIDNNVKQLLGWVQKLARLNPEIVYMKPAKERTRDSEREKDAKLLRRTAGEGVVLLKNAGALPITEKNKKVAVIGPNAKAAVVTGGGSASLRAAWAITPWQGLSDNKPAGVELDYAFGTKGAKFLPLLDENFTASDGSVGFDLLQYKIEDDGNMAKEPTDVSVWDRSEMLMADFQDLGSTYCTEVKATFTAPIDGEWDFSLAITGNGWLWLDDEKLLDLSTEVERGAAFFGMGTREVIGTVSVKKGQKYRLRVLHDSRLPPAAEKPASALGLVALRIGSAESYDAEKAMDKAVELAKQSDTAVVVVGLNADWESEGYDRPDLKIPLRQDELVSRVAAANPNTVVVVQAGSAVALPWLDKVSAVVWAWYGGNETGNAIADVVYGKRNPSGRLPISLPKREEDIAANLNFKSARTKIYYEEGIWVGYKHHNARKIEPLFPFGHGLSYTSWAYDNLTIVEQPEKGAKPKADEWKLKVKVDVKNTGNEVGDHSVHFYLAPPAETPTSLKHPQWTLQAFDKVYGVKPGETKTVEVTLDKCRFSTRVVVNGG